MPGYSPTPAAAVLFPPRRGREADRAFATANIAVLHSLAEAEGAWRSLGASVPTSPYQSFDWVAAWFDTVGKAGGVKPAIILVQDEAGSPSGLLPLCIRPLGSLRVASFAGGRDSNGNMGLFHPNADWTLPRLQAVLRGAARQARIDLFALTNLRGSWAACPNPLLQFGAQPSPSANHAAALPWTPERLSKPGRKKLRSKMSKLRSLGAVSFEHARTPAEVESLLDCHVAQKAARFAQLGLNASEDMATLRAFFARAAAPVSGAPSVELFALRCGDDIVATFGGTGNSARFSGMVISHDRSERYAACSPGDLLVAEVMAEKTRLGVASFDLGIGESRYKDSFCPTVEPLFDVVLGFTLRGRVVSAMSRKATTLKRQVKQSPVLWPVAQRIRKVLGPLRRPRAGS